ncbi:MAG: hypothetical protein BWY68_00858 [bacterium ADurb.Bin400]|nr:MAG: hypothetical protein BWY68_00858 [bacterium ADurb.Bin400]
MLAAVTLIVVVSATYVYDQKREKKGSGTDSQPYYAVFLDNRETYFGHIKRTTSGYLILTDVYFSDSYDQSSPFYSNTFGSADTLANTTIIKYTDDAHRPEDEIYINNDRIIHYEKLSGNSPVLTRIRKYQKDSLEGTQ